MQWDLLDITCGLAGWRMTSADPVDDTEPAAGCAMSFRLAGGLARLSVTLRPPGGTHGGSTRTLQVDEEGVKPELRGLAAAVLGPRLVGEGSPPPFSCPFCFRVP